MNQIKTTSNYSNRPLNPKHLFANALQILLPLSLLLATANIHAAERDTYESNGISFSISVRTPDQIRAFYTGRGFPEAAIAELTSKCLLTIGVRNHRKDIVWMEPAKWEFTTMHGTKVLRISRDAWDKRWAEQNIPLANRATFGWTQLPESRDLYPDETAGGNIAIQPPSEPFTVTASFDTSEDRSGAPVTFQSAPLTCGTLSGTQQ
ncbi:hypothetical protein [Sulfuriferula nivalis]|uniref:Uncharacterized protein n=1 Tax=Sulfuriferula nivalis TaxID=2675298 RepID=A0A809RIX3_9PROT|nr:hypothetical protein [Sulfuriferula nivalis]BBP01546.1 hypothetical protein SFSGTM_22540 [Sulfuriferula nivalis]